jgi:hypothetical protein
VFPTAEIDCIPDLEGHFESAEYTVSDRFCPRSSASFAFGVSTGLPPKGTRPLLSWRAFDLGPSEKNA